MPDNDGYGENGGRDRGGYKAGFSKKANPAL